MNLSRIEKIASAVLYEGYMLYPYRPSSTKNTQRFNFGVVYPRSYSEAQSGSDRWFLQTEVVVAGGEPILEVVVRFLHLTSRIVAQIDPPADMLDSKAEATAEVVEELRVGEQIHRPWEGAVERQIQLPPLRLADLVVQERLHGFDFPSSVEKEAIRDGSGQVVGLLIHRQEAIRGTVLVVACACGANRFKVSIRVRNDDNSFSGGEDSREHALKRSFVSTHTIVGVQQGEFFSLLDPPAELRPLVEDCRNLGVWPVLVGEEGDRDCMLSSPITLYDYPQIAPESGVNLFDGTEIDEILSLRILALTEEEKREMRSADERSKRILDQVESMAEDQLMRLHGTVRQLRPDRNRDSEREP